MRRNLSGYLMKVWNGSSGNGRVAVKVMCKRGRDAVHVICVNGRYAARIVCADGKKAEYNY